jgi:hypothetical protein
MRILRLRFDQRNKKRVQVHALFKFNRTQNPSTARHGHEAHDFFGLCIEVMLFWFELK